MEQSLHFAEEVVQARRDGTAVVALETTILSHGMPYPRNLETARAVERAVRAAGAVPATIAVLDGAVTVGLDAAQLERVAVKPMLKLGRADLAYAVASRRSGATTVAATMDCAALAGISVFATGGIGGVHRGVERTMDVSGDLEALATTPVTVVCSGAKAILDLPKTLEQLETRGVPVIGYRTNDLPAFWSRESGLPLALRLDTPREVAALIRAQRALGLRGGIVVANPIPQDEEIPAIEMRRYVDAAIEDANASRIAGRALTPWLLDRILSLTNGRSLNANVALVLANAKLAAEIALAVIAA
jgi:pseudouridine-5'-phosphate glycosidase